MNVTHFVGESCFSGTDADDGDVVESSRVRNGGRRQVTLWRMRHDDGENLLSYQIAAHLKRRPNRVQI